MKLRAKCLAFSLAALVTMLSLVLLPSVAFAASQSITNEAGTTFSNFSEALAAVPDGGTTTLTIKSDGKDPAALDLTLERNIAVKVVTKQANSTARVRLGQVDVRAGDLELYDPTGQAGKSYHSLIVKGLRCQGGSVNIKNYEIDGLVRLEGSASFALEGCRVKDPESARSRRGDSLATVNLAGSSKGNLYSCEIDGDVGVGSGCTIGKIWKTKIVSHGDHSAIGLSVGAGGKVGEIRDSLIYGREKSMVFKSASSTIVESSYLISGRGNPILRGDTASDWRGTKIEKSLEGSQSAFGTGGYYGSDREFDVTWFKGVIPDGYELSRWTRQVEVPFINQTFDLRYLVRKDCSLTYDANGGTGSMASSNKTNQYGDRKQRVAKCAFTNGDKTFKNWNTKPDGTGTTYKPGSNLSFGSQCHVTLYAQWGGEKYTLRFDSRGGTSVPSQTVDAGKPFTRPQDPTYAVGSVSYDFAGWYADPDLKQEFDFSKPTSQKATTVYARWVPSTCTLVFDSMGGSHVDGVTVKYGQAAARPADPTRGHYRFQGWYADERCTRAYDFSTKLTEEETTVYAKWGDYDECHVWGEGTVTQEPKCHERGLKTYTCTADPQHTHTRTERMRALGCTPDGQGFVPYLWDDPIWRDSFYKAPSCTKEGWGLLAECCQRCGQPIRTMWKSIPSLGHDWGGWVEVNAATENSSGLDRRVCRRDSSHVEEKVTPQRHNHDLERIAPVTATCTADGNVEYWRCKDANCRACFSDSEGKNSVPEDEMRTTCPCTPGVSQVEVVREPTCVDEGESVEVVKCTVCGEELYRNPITTEATGVHTSGEPDKANYVEASCEHAGTHDEVVCCTVCGQVLSWKTVEDGPALGHQAAAPVRENVDPATCEEDGGHNEAVHCARCGDIMSWTWQLDEATGHDWGVWETVIEATEYDEGLARRTCAHDVAHVEYRAIPRVGHVHELTSVPAQDATCASVGHKEYWLCAGCGEWFLDAEGTRPLERESDVVAPRLAHKPAEPVDEDAVPATCEEDGHHDKAVYCADCGKLLSRETVIDEALGHDWDSWEEEVPASSADAGLMRRVCKRDGSHVEEKVIPRLHDHILEYVEAVPATCWAEGTRAHYRCTDEHCGALFSGKDGDALQSVSAAELAIPRNAHTPADKVVEEQSASTCLHEGVNHEVVYCAECGKELTRDVVPLPLLAHTPGDPVRENEVASTCSVKGTHDEVTYCAVCQEELSRRNVSDPRAEHTPGEVQIVNVIPATATEPGSHDEVVCCVVCDSVISWETIVDPPAEAAYYVAEGAQGSWTKGSQATLVFTFKRTEFDEETFDLFQGLEVDGQAVPEDGFTAEAGSVVVTLKPAYLETLSVGEHTLTALFEDGNAEMTFSVLAEPTPTPSPTPTPTSAPSKDVLPRTADAAHGGVVLALAASGLACVVLALASRRKGVRKPDSTTPCQ